MVSSAAVRIVSFYYPLCKIIAKYICRNPNKHGYCRKNSGGTISVPPLKLCRILISHIEILINAFPVCCDAVVFVAIGEVCPEDVQNQILDIGLGFCFVKAVIQFADSVR